MSFFDRIKAPQNAADAYLETLRQERERRAVVAQMRAAEERGDEIKDKCSTLTGFVEEMWSVLEPQTKLKMGLPVYAIAEHLEAITYGELRHVLINVPPGPGWVENLVMTERGRVRLGSICVGDMVLTHRGRFKPVTAIYSKGDLETLKLTTKSGRVIHATPDHNLLTPSGWIEAGKLHVHDRLGWVTPEEGLTQSLINNAEARLLGYLVGDGSLTQATTGFTNQDDDVIADFELCAASLGFTTAKTRRGAHWHVRINGGKPVRNWLEGHGLLKASSYTKFIPEAVLSSSNEVIKNFIGAYWSCDGMINVKPSRTRTAHYHANATTVSERLARDVMHALGRLGIRASLRAKSRKLETAAQPGGVYNSFTVEVYSEADTAKFIDMPGLSERKNARAKLCEHRRFDAILNEDPIVSIEDAGPLECMCISVADDHSLTWDDIAVHNTMKSMLCSVFWSAWEWGPKGMPWLRSIGTSGVGAQMRDADRMQQLILSPLYQALWPEVKLRRNRRGKDDFENTSTGFRQGLSFDDLTGKRGHRIIIDDPNKIKGETDNERRKKVETFNTVVPSRLNDFDTDAILLIQQRTHEEDISGEIIRNHHEYTKLILPMEYEVKRPCVTSIGFKDPRTHEGELLFPDRFSPAVVEGLKSSMGANAYATQYQQRPAPAGGGLIKTAWFKRYIPGDMPPLLWRAIYADTAQKTKERHDFSVFQCWGVTSNRRAYLIDQIRGKWEAPDLKKRAIAFWQKHEVIEPEDIGALRGMWVEDKSSGTGLIQDIRTGDGDILIPIFPVKRSLDKVTRVMDAAPRIEAGMVYVPADESTPWIEGYLAECEAFTADMTHAHDDQIDPTCDAVQSMIGGNDLQNFLEAFS